MLKPVKREELAQALQQLETRLAQRMRRVLVVEDDPVQLDSLRKLLGSHDVETVGVGTAAECLEHLKERDVRLHGARPVAAGCLRLLAPRNAQPRGCLCVSAGDRLHRPRSSADEEQQLRRYSKSIIIKGAKSPERLLDEVTLFLHQVVAELPRRAAADAREGQEPGCRAGGPPHPGRRGRRPQRLRADEHPRAAGCHGADRPKRPRGARSPGAVAGRPPAERSISC